MPAFVKGYSDLQLTDDRMLGRLRLLLLLLRKTIVVRYQPRLMTTSATSSSTSMTLIERLRALDAESWQLLSELYSPLVYGWARQTGLQSHDAADVLQNVLMSVMRGVEKFSYDKPGASFRGWLWTITRNAVRALVRSRGSHPIAAVEGEALQTLAVPSEPDESNGDPTDPGEFTTLTHRALGLVRQRVDAHTWDAFWRTTVEEQSAEEVGTALGMTSAAVRQAKFRVLCRLRGLLADR